MNFIIYRINGKIFKLLLNSINLMINIYTLYSPIILINKYWVILLNWYNLNNITIYNSYTIFKIISKY